MTRQVVHTESSSSSNKKQSQLPPLHLPPVTQFSDAGVLTTRFANGAEMVVFHSDSTDTPKQPPYSSRLRIEKLPLPMNGVVTPRTDAASHSTSARNVNAYENTQKQLQAVKHAKLEQRFLEKEKEYRRIQDDIKRRAEEIKVKEDAEFSRKLNAILQADRADVYTNISSADNRRHRKLCALQIDKYGNQRHSSKPSEHQAVATN
eukprot:GILJ01008000.1.p1 GENE.GILJ01008000.1~~GILJ01008000.1.p1  ORF type:complete len:220 (+),score=47.31 GILJ01008000.1:46-660(+)